MRLGHVLFTRNHKIGPDDAKESFTHGRDGITLEHEGMWVLVRYDPASDDRVRKGQSAAEKLIPITQVDEATPAPAVKK